MFSAFLNPWMLLGLAGLVLPVLAHLLSRKKYDQVDWGAMQFLEIDPSAKRKIRLEELLLLFVRMGLIGVVAIALARPWLGGAWLGHFASTESRDVVLVIDGSYSMGWEAKTLTPQARAVQLSRTFLNDLRPGDTVQIIDAREQPRVVFPEATRDSYRAREALNDLPTPAGSADLPAAINKAVQLLAAGTNLQREVVVLTDLQARGWQVDDEIHWARFDDVRSQSPIPARVWIIDAADGEMGAAVNFTIERLHLSRELAVVDAPVKVSSNVKYSGGDSVMARKVFLEIDGQRIGDQTMQIRIQPRGEATVELEHRFSLAGSHLISLVLDNDAMPGDNRADAVVTVTESLPVLLVDGDRHADPTKCESYFAKAALLAAGTDHPWIKATLVTPDEISSDHLKSSAIVVLANVAKMSPETIASLKSFVTSGHAVLFTLGDQVDLVQYRKMFSAADQDLFPGRLESLVHENEREKRGVRVDSKSIELPWLRPFRADEGGTLSDARWSRWWQVTPSVGGLAAQPPVDASNNPPPDEQINDANQPPDSPAVTGTAVVEARLTTGDPLIVSRRLGRGMTAIFTSTLDADWNTLPAKQDYVPFLHEFLFSLAVPIASRNVNVGAPLMMEIPAELPVDEYHFVNPANKSQPAERIEGPTQTIVRLRTTPLAGVYKFQRKNTKPGELDHTDYFVANFDRGESDLTTLTVEQRDTLSSNKRMTFVTDLPDLRRGMFAASSRMELWWMLLYVFLGSLGMETWMTRRMVRGGYTAPTE